MKTYRFARHTVFLVIVFAIGSRVAAAGQEPDGENSKPDEPQATQTAPPEKVIIPLPEHTGLNTMVHDVIEDFKHLPSRQSLWITLGGGGLALAVHPADHSVNSRLAGHDSVFTPGAAIGNTATLVGGAFITWGIAKATGHPKLSHTGLDIMRAVAESEAIIQTVKYTVRRERPDRSSGYSFPSGHATETFAVATVVERHPGFRWSIPVYAIASYVAISRLHDNVHYLSDVVFGATVGTIVGRTVTRHGASNFALVPIAVPHGAALAFLYQKPNR